MSPADLVTIHATSPIQQAVYIHNSPPLFVEDLSVVLLCYYNYELHMQLHPSKHHQFIPYMYLPLPASVCVVNASNKCMKFLALCYIIHRCIHVLSVSGCRFYKRWKEEEQRQAHLQRYSLGEDQLRQDWAAVLALADQKRKSLEQIHVFALAHVLRRPVVVYGVKVVKNFRGENLGFVNFEGMS